MECEQICRKNKNICPQNDPRKDLEILKYKSQEKHIYRMRQARQKQKSQSVKALYNCENRPISKSAFSEVSQPKRKERQKWHKNNCRAKEDPLEQFKKNMEKLNKKSQNKINNILYKAPVYDSHQMKHIIRIRKENERQKSYLANRFGIGIEHQQPQQKKLKCSNNYHDGDNINHDGDNINMKCEQEYPFDQFHKSSGSKSKMGLEASNFETTSLNDSKTAMIPQPKTFSEPNNVSKHDLSTNSKEKSLEKIEENANTLGTNLKSDKLSKADRNRCVKSLNSKNYYIFNQNKVVPLKSFSEAKGLFFREWNQSAYLEFFEHGDHTEIPIEAITPKIQYFAAKPLHSNFKREFEERTVSNKKFKKTPKLLSQKRITNRKNNSKITTAKSPKSKLEKSIKRISSNLRKKSAKKSKKSKTAKFENPNETSLKEESAGFTLQTHKPIEISLDYTAATEDVASQKPVVFFPKVSIIELINSADPSVMLKNESI